MLVLADLDSTKENICAAVARPKQNPDTQHVPVLAFTANLTPELQAAAETSGVTLLVSEQAVLNHLGECLEQALEVK
jgi:CheY-like chemotaxis protein